MKSQISFPKEIYKINPVEIVLTGFILYLSKFDYTN